MEHQKADTVKRRVPCAKISQSVTRRQANGKRAQGPGQLSLLEHRPAAPGWRSGFNPWSGHKKQPVNEWNNGLMFLSLPLSLKSIKKKNKKIGPVFEFLHRKYLNG